MRTLALLTTFALIALLCPAVGAQGRGGRDGRRQYDPATVETVTGKVTHVEHVKRRRGPSDMVQVTLETDGGPLRVNVGPASFLSEKKMVLATGDRIEVRGSRVTHDGEPLLIAAEITKGDTRLALRDAAGVPVWRAARR